MNNEIVNFNLEEFGSRLSELRKISGLSQTQLADILNISHKHLNNIECGRKGPSIDLLMIIAAHFHVSADYLLTGQVDSDDFFTELYQAATETVQNAVRMKDLLAFRLGKTPESPWSPASP